MNRREARMVAEELFSLMEKSGVFEEKYLSAREAADMLGIPLQTLYNKIETIPHTKVGKRLRFSDRSLRQYLNR